MRREDEEKEGMKEKGRRYLWCVVAFGGGEPLCARDEVALGRRICRAEYLDSASREELSRVQAVRSWEGDKSNEAKEGAGLDSHS